MKKMRFFLFFLALVLSASSLLQAQSARLGVQGILKKANGNAVDDGNYDLTFKLYNVTSGGSALWTETQTDVEVASGVYTVTLGSVAPLNVPFNETYYLGVTVGGTTEMTPRIQLTTAPYALSLIGNTNQFPSSGKVIVDSMVVKGRMGVGTSALPPLTGQAGSAMLWVDGGIRANGGAPASNNTTNRGYAFVNNNGDNDSGMFSTADGFVSLYSNASELLRVWGGGTGNPTVNIKTNGLIDNSLTINDQLIVTGLSTMNNDVTLQNGAGINYKVSSTTYDGWRLVDRDDFLAGSVDGWQGTSALVSTTAATIENVSYGTFNGNVIRPSGASNTPALKKLFNLSGAGSYNFVKVVFKYYFTDSWDQDNEVAIAGFSTDLNATDPVICWQTTNQVYSTGGTADYTGSGTWSDGAAIGQMVANTSSTSFYVFVAMRSDDDTGNERYALGNVEVWVR